jgi:hypothetical protein
LATCGGRGSGRSARHPDGLSSRCCPRCCPYPRWV